MSNTQQQPEALRLADELERDIYRVVGEKPTQAAAAELRRLHDLLGKANALCRIRFERIKELEAAACKAPLSDDEFISMVDSAGLVINPDLAFEIKEMVERAHGIEVKA